MYKSFIWLLKLFIFWILLFYVQQIIFLFLNTSYFADISISQFFKALYYGLLMNISSASYLMILPFIFLIISNFTKKDKWIVKTANWIIVFQIILCVITGVIDAGLFSAWGTKLNAKAISYISYPSEMLKGIGSVSLPLLISYLLLITFLSLFCYYKFFKFSIFYKIRFWKFLVFSIFISALLIIGSRGGLQTRPINKGWAFHSTNQCLNYSAVNSLWNFFDIFINREDNNNQYQFFDDEKAKAIVAKMHQYSKDSNEFILTMKHPNIVMILMESISAENMILLGGKEEVMPGLDSLCKYGILFSDFYANGVRTEQGLIALLSGFPAQPANTVIRHFGKFENLPHIGRILLENGYSNNYYYSGNLDYANTKSYLLSGGFSKIIGDEQKWKTKTQWGAYDEEIFDYHLKHSNGDKQPFFSIK